MDSLFDPERYPRAPGCFLIKDAEGRALLVGGTVNLSRRLAALYAESAQPPPKTRVRNRVDDRLSRLVALARSVEVFILPNPDDCPALANSLIERHRPLFNLATYLEPSGGAYMTLTAEPYPRLIAGRFLAAGEDPRECFGPFPAATRDLLIKAATETFGLRTCQPLPRRACLSYQLKLCSAPCEGRVSPEEYAEQVGQAARLLAAPGSELIEALSARMQSAAAALEFERAGRIRGQIDALRPALQNLSAVRASHRPGDHDQDAVYLADGKALIVQVRCGALYDMLFRAAPGPAAHFLREHYRQDCPAELILNLPLADLAGLAAELSAACGHPVILTLPAGDPLNELLEIARLNHEYRTSQP